MTNYNKGEGRILTSVKISQEFFNLAKEHKIVFAEAMRVGLSLMFAEIGIKEYDNKLNLYRKMTLLREKLEKTSKELYDLKEKAKNQIHNN
jgi:hypothetical protein